MSTSNDATPNPGSEDAVALGCTCPVLDNCHGTGVVGRPGLFWISGDCSVHICDKQDNSERKNNVATTDSR